jgi:hypothetical protein
MVKRCLIVTMDESALPFVQTLNTLGLDCAFLDFCAQTSQFLRVQKITSPVIRVGPHKTDVVENEAIRAFDTAVVFEGTWLESALIVQALKQAGIGKVVVVAQHQSFMRAYRALGADRVVGVRRWNRDSMRVLSGTSERRRA